MKEKRFTIGQKVTPLTRKIWVEVQYGTRVESNRSPKAGEIYTVSGYHEFYNGWGWFIILQELGSLSSYEENCFDPVISDSVLEEALSEIEETVTI